MKRYVPGHEILCECNSWRCILIIHGRCANNSLQKSIDAWAAE